MDGLRKSGLEKRAVGDLHSKIKGKSCIKLVLKKTVGPLSVADLY